MVKWENIQFEICILTSLNIFYRIIKFLSKLLKVFYWKRYQLNPWCSSLQYIIAFGLTLLKKIYFNLSCMWGISYSLWIIFMKIVHFNISHPIKKTLARERFLSLKQTIQGLVINPKQWWIMIKLRWSL